MEFMTFSDRFDIILKKSLFYVKLSGRNIENNLKYFCISISDNYKQHVMAKLTINILDLFLFIKVRLYFIVITQNYFFKISIVRLKDLSRD